MLLPNRIKTIEKGENTTLISITLLTITNALLIKKSGIAMNKKIILE